MWFRIKYIAVTVFWNVFKPFRQIYRLIFKPARSGVKVVVIKDKRVLLVRPNYAHRQWTFPGGGVKRNESFETAGIREAFEETGLRVDHLKFIREYPLSQRYVTGVTRVFTADLIADEKPQADGIEIQEAGWFQLDTLPSDRVPRVDETLAIYHAMNQERPGTPDLSHPTESHHARRDS